MEQRTDSPEGIAARNKALQEHEDSWLNREKPPQTGGLNSPDDIVVQEEQAPEQRTDAV